MRLRRIALSMATTAALATPAILSATSPAEAAYVKNPFCTVNKTIVKVRQGFFIRCLNFKGKSLVQVSRSINGVGDSRATRKIRTNNVGFFYLGTSVNSVGYAVYKIDGVNSAGKHVHKVIWVIVTPRNVVHPRYR